MATGPDKPDNNTAHHSSFIIIVFTHAHVISYQFTHVQIVPIKTHILYTWKKQMPSVEINW